MSYISFKKVKGQRLDHMIYWDIQTGEEVMSDFPELSGLQQISKSWNLCVMLSVSSLGQINNSLDWDISYISDLISHEAINMVHIKMYPSISLYGTQRKNSYFFGIVPICDVELTCIFQPVFPFVHWIEDRSQYYNINF